MNEIEALLGMGISDEEQLRALANSLRGKQQAADFFALSTVPNIQKAAAAKQEAILGSAREAGGLRRSILDRRSNEEQERLNRDLEERKLTSREEQARLDRRHEEDLAREGWLQDALIAEQRAGQPNLGVDQYLDPETGEVRAYPGSKLDLEQKAAARTLEASRETSRQSLDNVLRVVDLAAPKVGWFTTGLAGAAAEKAKRPDRMDLQGYITTLQSELGIGTLLAMKQASKSGSTGFGALSEKELDLVVSKITSLNLDQSEEAVLENLSYIRDWAKRARLEFDDEYQAALAEKANRGN